MLAEDKAACEDAANDLVGLAKAGGDACQIFALLAEPLQQSRSVVREAAVRVVVQLAAQSHPEAVATLVALASDSSTTVRELAACSLAGISPSGGDEAMCKIIAAVAAMTGKEQWRVRATAAFALGKLVAGDRRLVATALPGVLECLRDQNAEVRKAGAGALEVLCKTGDAAAVKALLVAAGDGRGDVRKDAAPLVKSLALTKDDPAVMNVVMELLSDDRPDVRYAAAYVLPKVAPKGDKIAVAKLKLIIADSSIQVRGAALDALRQLVAVGESGVTVAIAACLADDEPQVQLKALRALKELTSRGASGAATRAAVQAHFKDERWAVRCAGLRALREVVPEGDKDAVAAAAGFLADEDWNLRWEAVSTLSYLTPRGDEAAAAASIAAVTAHLIHDKMLVRFFAFWALWRLADRDYGSTIGTAAALFGAVAAAFVLCGLQALDESSAATVPFRPSSSSWLFCALCALMRSFAVSTLMYLAVKGRGCLAGAGVTAIGAGAMGCVFFR